MDLGPGLADTERLRSARVGFGGGFGVVEAAHTAVPG